MQDIQFGRSFMLFYYFTGYLTCDRVKTEAAGLTLKNGDPSLLFSHPTPLTSSKTVHQKFPFMRRHFICSQRQFRLPSTEPKVIYDLNRTCTEHGGNESRRDVTNHVGFQSNLGSARFNAQLILTK